MTERLTDAVKEFLETCQGREVSLKYLRDELKINPNTPQWNSLRVLMGRLIEDRTVKPSGKNDGVYKVLLPIKPITRLDNENETPLDFRFPRNYNEEESEFGFEDSLEVFPGDMILVTGRSNQGKTTMALSIMAENLGLMPAFLMGSEYTAADGKISPKFVRRLKRMNWSNLLNDDGTFGFSLLPVGSDYEDYVEPDCLNIIDWISLNGEYYLIDGVMKKIKDRVGNGVAVVVLQKNKDAEFGEGGERTQRYADVELRIDSLGENESMLTIGKVKSPKGRATGRTWAFSITDYGANFSDIREIVKCRNCWGKGWKKQGTTSIPCNFCSKTGYINKS